MNNITIAGTIGRNAEIRRTQDGTPIASFSVAVSNGKDANGNWRDSTWLDCSMFGKRGETLAQHLTKGSKVAVSGKVSARAHEGKAYLQIRVDQVTMLGGGQSAEAQQEPAGQQGGGGFDMDEEVPF